eukprot:scaffold127323_cov31-Tisochrysis_lutea.AAC.1
MTTIAERLASLQASSKTGSFIPGRGPDPTGACYVPRTASSREPPTPTPTQVDSEEGGAISERRAALEAAANRPAELSPREEVAHNSSISGFRPDYGRTDSILVETKNFTRDGAGLPLMSGWIKKNGKGLKAKVFTPFWCTLHAETCALAFYVDERAEQPKLVMRLDSSASIQQHGDFLVLRTAAEDVMDVVGISTKRVVETRMQADTSEEATIWARKIEEAASAASTIGTT